MGNDNEKDGVTHAFPKAPLQSAKPLGLSQAACSEPAQDVAVHFIVHVVIIAGGCGHLTEAVSTRLQAAVMSHEGMYLR